MKIGVAQADVELSGVLLREKTIVASLEIRTPLACSVTCTKTSVLTPRAMPEEHALCTRHQTIHPNPSMLQGSRLPKFPAQIANLTAQCGGLVKSIL
jgi:hypothetical protein